ncbi:MAG: hypothetical protein P1U36_10790 [Legionellaceae bacterium]|nr:hypothetical protein [Legionellaceae bacterium]
MENKISVDDAYTQFNDLEKQHYEAAGYGSPKSQLSADDPNAIAVDYFNYKSDDFGKKLYPSSGVSLLKTTHKENLRHASIGISEGVKDGKITAEQAEQLYKELDDNVTKLKNLSKSPLSEEEQAESDAINNRLAEIQDECGYVKPERNNASSSSNEEAYEASEQNNASPQQVDSKNSPILTGLAVLAIAALALLAIIFLPIALPVIVGAAALTASAVIAYRHGPEIMSAFNAEAPARSASSSMHHDASNMHNDTPEVENEQELEADINDELNAEFDTPEIEDEQELEIDINEEPEIEKPDADIEKPIPKKGLNDSPTQTKGDDLKNALHEIPEASPEISSEETKPTQDNEDDYDSSSSMRL